MRAEIQERYRNRYCGLSQNVLAVCDHDMRFVYIQVGYEGSAHDARILRNTLLDLNLGFPMAPEGMPPYCYFSYVEGNNFTLCGINCVAWIASAQLCSYVHLTYNTDSNLISWLLRKILCGGYCIH